MADNAKSVDRIISAYQSAVLAKDIAAFMKPYHPKVRVFDTWGVWSYEGAQAWQSAVEGWFTSLGTEQVRVSFEQVVITDIGDGAIVTAFVSYAGFTQDGQPLQQMHNRLTWGLKESGHVLRIVHEHTSAPIGFEDMLAILQLAPPSS